MKKSIIALLTLPLLLSSYGGMWEPYQMPSLKKELRDAGFYKNEKYQQPLRVSNECNR